MVVSATDVAGKPGAGGHRPGCCHHRAARKDGFIHGTRICLWMWRGGCRPTPICTGQPHCSGLWDWEGWGLAPAGFDAASLYLHSVGVPKLAEHVQSMFAEALDTLDGMLAQLYVASRMKSRGDLDEPATSHAVASSVLDRQTTPQ